MRQWLKEMRDNRGLTQEEVAKLAGISRTHYTHLEQGNKNPSVTVAKKVAKALRFSWVLFFETNSSVTEQKERDVS